ncbi:bifunctional methylenetetrahydrofolate dehydrogenase/methenyltetrahydrofolate cyclohydrolase FolD [Cardiobacterium hominis]|jgi:bifunctional protein folD|uniref:Bifunctional protein FolD n=2 Tax=Cardiobacterium hominis TaxID=2718 RepID=C8N838_CARH6|nr:bifunctional methylenetetrahydrofolate dehydrogenase/methenyltetrahydrofolate cyclohydrolase FolD [Cardiobacterium hominis]EEV89215.1 tetrahydrofolate dehydrogenase/cyclohydrolase, NAD(P)-binding domain protein [Cardiobacterium hominis ATCC 15826]SAY96027.1 Methylenetetrahydrofolate dehydrogenase (NADP+) / Methenyltetrahydrofolate cyclohydrolase [Cardiobacterium hominis]VEG77277.1 Bifunctional protein FolD [Cardiobacterium hominis]
MSAEIIDGKAFAAKIRAEVAQECAAFRAQTGVQPGLAVVLVGNDAASEVYVRNKGIQAKEAGFNSLEYRLPAETTQSELLAQVAALNADPQVHGILVQLPLPAHLDADAVLNAIAPDKDVDGFHPVNVGRLWTGNPVSIPCTPLGCALILKDRLGDLSGKRAIVIGRSNIVGKPMAALLLAANATVTIAHSRTADLAARCREADIVIAAVGKPELVRGDWLKAGATVLDVGINRIAEGEKTRLVGDVHFASAVAVAGAITPVPGGIGPMTIACLLRNTLACAKALHGTHD